jgi:hypothetical protein
LKHTLPLFVCCVAGEGPKGKKKKKEGGAGMEEEAIEAEAGWATVGKGGKAKEPKVSFFFWGVRGLPHL